MSPWLFSGRLKKAAVRRTFEAAPLGRNSFGLTPAKAFPSPASKTVTQSTSQEHSNKVHSPPRTIHFGTAVLSFPCFSHCCLFANNVFDLPTRQPRRLSIVQGGGEKYASVVSMLSKHMRLCDQHRQKQLVTTVRVETTACFRCNRTQGRVLPLLQSEWLTHTTKHLLKHHLQEGEGHPCAPQQCLHPFQIFRRIIRHS